jgi:hypothetical protein
MPIIELLAAAGYALYKASTSSSSSDPPDDDDDDDDDVGTGGSGWDWPDEDPKELPEARHANIHDM